MCRGSRRAWPSERQQQRQASRDRFRRRQPGASGASQATPASMFTVLGFDRLTGRAEIVVVVDVAVALANRVPGGDQCHGLNVSLAAPPRGDTAHFPRLVTLEQPLSAEHPVSTRGLHLGLAAVFVTSVLGCTSWSRLSDSQPVPSRGTVQVWSQGQEILLRDPRTVGDSLVGRAPDPDTTRLTVALSVIDSLRTQTFDMGKALIVGTGVALALLYAYASNVGGD
jgi:hypothetical protein